MSSRPAAALASALFALIGPGLEAGVGPWLITGGWAAGDPPPPAIVAGVSVIVVGLALLAWCFSGFVRDGLGSPSPLAPPRRLVARGPYRWVRNPMYLATAAVIAGEGLALDRPVLLACALLYLTALALQVRLLEEPRLRARFGSAYDGYLERVPAWLPRRPH